MSALTCQQSSSSNTCLVCQEDDYFEFVIPYIDMVIVFSSSTYVYAEQDKRVTIHSSLFHTLNAYLCCYLC